MIKINGVEYQGSTVTFRNGSVWIDGKKIDDEATNPNSDRILEVHITGDAAEVVSDRSVTVKGNVLGSVDAGSSVACGDVGKSVDAGSSVVCGNVGGNVDAGSSVTAASVKGSIDAGGSVSIRQ